MSGAGRLPEGFQAMEPFVDEWAVPTSDGRKWKRIESTAEERQAFYDAVTPFAEGGLAYLDTIPIATWDRSQQTLMYLLLTLVHVSLAVEKQRDNEARHAINHAHFTITRSTEDALVIH